MIKLGSHISFKFPLYLVGAVEEAIFYNANTLMIYLGAPQNTLRTKVSNYKYDEYLKKYSKLIKPEDIIVHAPYIVNPSNPEKSKFAIEFLVQEIERMNYIGSKLLVLHPGASLKFGKNLAIDTLVNSLKQIFSKTIDVEIMLETMSGKGSEIGSTLEELQIIINKVNDPRLGICLDTCHIWDSGYNIKNDLDVFINKLKILNLLKFVKVIHLNDSKNDLFSRKDRHENIGKGLIGFQALQNFLYHPEFEGIITILETPWVNNVPIYKEEIKKLIKK